MCTARKHLEIVNRLVRPKWVGFELHRLQQSPTYDIHPYDT